ncbi:uncharacterized protein LOC124927802 [Impatiens glandulifera]|uniref:uncharacterized protein LOC124927802 n=1 Tax=Impatiens glandulifera TaxID=253017 RepID=UPI001FB16077|nr:uncharacterized protein LOC124927802 [Impatiens glandulifera]
MEICESSSSSNEIHQPILRNAKYAYSRHDLLSLGKLKHCRNFPDGFVSSNLKELGIIDSSCMQDLLNGDESKHGLLSSPFENFSRRRSSRSKENETSKDEVISMANDCCQLKKSVNPYRPPHSRTKADHSSQEASSGTYSDCDSNSIIFYEIVEEQEHQRKENQSRHDEDDEDWDEIMSILRVKQESLISHETKDDQTLNKSKTTEICLPDDEDLITTNDLLLLQPAGGSSIPHKTRMHPKLKLSNVEPILEYSLPDEDSLISVQDLLNPFGKIDQENFHDHHHHHYSLHHQQHRMNSQGNSSLMVSGNSNYYHTRKQDLLAGRFNQESLQTTPLPYGVDHLTNPNYPYHHQIYPSDNPNRWSLNTDMGAGFDRQSRAFVGYAHARK